MSWSLRERQPIGAENAYASKAGGGDSCCNEERRRVLAGANGADGRSSDAITSKATIVGARTPLVTNP